MRQSTIASDSPSDIAILARVLGNDDGTLPPQMARYVLTCGFSEADKSRMHDLTMRNQDDALSVEELDELRAFANAGTLLSILKSRARRVLRTKAKKRSSS